MLVVAQGNSTLGVLNQAWEKMDYLLKRFSRSQFPTNGSTKFLLPLPLVGISFGISTRHKRRQPSFGQLFIRQWQ
jgi:hypothetical protein